MRLFHKDGDYEAFERVLTEGFSRYPVDRRPNGSRIHPPRSRPAAEDAKQSVMSPVLSPGGRFLAVQSKGQALRTAAGFEEFAQWRRPSGEPAVLKLPV